MNAWSIADRLAHWLHSRHLLPQSAMSRVCRRWNGGGDDWNLRGGCFDRMFMEGEPVVTVTPSAGLTLTPAQTIRLSWPSDA